MAADDDDRKSRTRAGQSCPYLTADEIGQHLSDDVIDTRRQTQLEVGDSKWSARAIYLCIISVQVWAETVLFYKTDCVRHYNSCSVCIISVFYSRDNEAVEKLNGVTSSGL